MTMTWKNSKEVFEQAIREGRLSTDKTAPNYAGEFMYMGTVLTGPNGNIKEQDLFKSIETRRYLGIGPGALALCLGI